MRARSYHVHADNIGVDTAVQQMRIIGTSPHFQQYELREESAVVTPAVSLKLSGYKEAARRFVSLEEVWPFADAVLSIVEKNTSELTQAKLQLYAPESLKQSLNFDPEIVDELDLCVNVLVNPQNFNSYRFTVIDFGLNKGWFENPNLYRRTKEKYNKWHDQLDKALSGLLVHR